MVARRVVPLVAAFALAFAPTALEACQTSCLLHSVAMAAAGSAHHHHSESSPGSPTPAGHAHHHAAATEALESCIVIAGQTHLCENGDDLLAFSSALNSIV